MFPRHRSLFRLCTYNKNAFISKNLTTFDQINVLPQSYGIYQTTTRKIFDNQSIVSFLQSHKVFLI